MAALSALHFIVAANSAMQWLLHAPCKFFCAVAALSALHLIMAAMQWLLHAPCKLFGAVAALSALQFIMAAINAMQWMLHALSHLLWLPPTPCSECCMRLAIHSGFYQRHAVAAACALQGLWCSGCLAVEGLALLSCKGMLWL